MKVRSSNKKREQPPFKTHVARVLQLIDLGHQPGFVWDGGEAESSFRFEITYELVNSKMEDGRPFIISEEITNTDNEKGKLRQRLFATGVSFSNLQEMVGKPVMVSVEGNKKGYAKIANVTGVPEGFDVPQLFNETVLFDIYAEVPQLEVYHSLPEFKQNKIKQALDFKDTSLFKALEASGDLDTEESPY